MVNEAIKLLVELADRILTAWRACSDPACQIFACTDGKPHNTITPIARKREGNYELVKLQDKEYQDKLQIQIDYCTDHNGNEDGKAK